jgi:hypothetical protein
MIRTTNFILVRKHPTDEWLAKVGAEGWIAFTPEIETPNIVLLDSGADWQFVVKFFVMSVPMRKPGINYAVSLAPPVIS